jgi:aldose 1-epimerase
MRIERTVFGSTEREEPIFLYTLQSSSGSLLQMTNFGAILTKVVVQNREGVLQNVNLGFDSLEEYFQPHPFFGATVGRFCNRIAGGRFELDGRFYQLATNKGPHHIHGGTIGFDKHVWSAEEFLQPNEKAGVRFRLTSPSGDEGYPGNLNVVAEYSWSETNELCCTFSATCDQPTVINLTNHAYWNLAGAGFGTILDHQLQIYSDRYLEVDDYLIPTGNVLEVSNSPLDFRQPHRIGSRIDQLPKTKGYDHCFVIDGQAGQLRTAAIVQEPHSGRTMEVLTTQPGVQLYTGNHLSKKFEPHSGFCLETQHFPDSPNHPHFPTTRLDPGQTYQETTVYRFGIV